MNKGNNKKQVFTIQGDDLRRMQMLLLENIKEVDRVCRKNNIKYVIGFGTLLGAVRHKGFIPWDDDADICMTREEYEKFKKVQNQLDSNICFFQDNSTEKEYPWGYGKIRHANTTYIRLGQEHLKHRTGMMIDIFPMDDIPKSLLGMKLFESVGFLLRKMTYSHVAYKNVTSLGKRFIYRAMSLLPMRFPHHISRLLQHKLNNNSMNRAHMIFYPPFGLKHNIIPQIEKYGWKKSWLTDIAEYEFEGCNFWGPRDYNGCLRWCYGKDYMTPLPPNEREPHVPCSSYKM